MPRKLKQYLFEVGDHSRKGLGIGFSARINGSTKQEALRRLQEALSGRVEVSLDEYLEEAGSGEYLILYLEAENISVNQIVPGETEPAL